MAIFPIHPDTSEVIDNRKPDRKIVKRFSLKRINLTGLSLLSIAAAACGSSGQSSNVPSAASAKSTTTTQVPVQLSASEPSWQLKAPLSRMVLLPYGNNGAAILGGLTAADTSASGVFSLNFKNGSLQAIGNLPAAVHDAGGARIGSHYFVFGGGSVNTVSSVEAVGTSGGNGTLAGNLPQPRSDCSAITVGGVTYIIGGYNGSSPDPTVLSTTNGSTFSQISQLKVPVRYAALASENGFIYVFGGLGVSGPDAGKAVSTIQQIDISTGVTKIIGTLPIPLEGAQAFNLGGRMYLAGGDSGSGNNLTSNSLVWAYSGGSKFIQAATLPLGVSNAGVLVNGSTAWLVGGEHNGKTTAVVQKLKN